MLGQEAGQRNGAGRHPVAASSLSGKRRSRRFTRKVGPRVPRDRSPPAAPVSMSHVPPAGLMSLVSCHRAGSRFASGGPSARLSEEPLSPVFLSARFPAHKPPEICYTFSASFGRTEQHSPATRTAAGRAGRIGQSIANLVS